MPPASAYLSANPIFIHSIQKDTPGWYTAHILTHVSSAQPYPGSAVYGKCSGGILQLSGILSADGSVIQHRSTISFDNRNVLIYNLKWNLTGGADMPFTEICVYQVKPQKVDEFETLMGEVKEFLEKQEGVNLIQRKAMVLQRKTSMTVIGNPLKGA